MNGSQEFKCECNDGFDGKRCEIFICPLDCKNDALCEAEIGESGNKNWECHCEFPFQGKAELISSKTCNIIYIGQICAEVDCSDPMDHPCCGQPCHNGGSCASKAKINDTQVGF